MKTFFFFLMMVIARTICAQPEINLQNIYLNNGSVLHGQVLAIDTGYITMKVNATNITMLYADVKQIGGETNLNNGIKNKKWYGNISMKGMPGYENYYSYGIVPYNYSQSLMGWNIEMSGGYKLRHFLQAGIGIGATTFHLASAKNFVPVYAELKGEITKTKIAPCYKLEAGYAQAIQSKINKNAHVKGGTFFSPSIGIRFQKQNTATQISIGYMQQNASEKYTYEGTQFTEQYKRVYKRIFLNLGIDF